MTTDQQADKQSNGQTGTQSGTQSGGRDGRPIAAPIRMVGDADIHLVKDIGQRLGPDARILELGPFLGGVSVELAPFGALTVMDRFVWTEANARDYPGVAEAGGSFRPALEATLTGAGVEAAIHEADFREGPWPEGPFDLCFIDAPRSAKDLMACLAGLAGQMGQNGIILLKHGISPAHPEMVALVAGLMARGCVTLQASDQPEWCTISVLRVAEGFAALAEATEVEPYLTDPQLDPRLEDPWDGRRFQLARMAERLMAGDTALALTLLDQLPATPGTAAAWDQIEPSVAAGGADATMLAVFSELLSVQADVSHAYGPLRPIDGSPVLALRGYWHNNAGMPWRVARFAPEHLVTAQASGATALPQMLEGRLQGRHVVELGSGLGHSGTGFTAAGVASYTGIDLGEETAPPAPTEGVCVIPEPELEGACLPEADLLVVHHGCREAAARVLPLLPKEIERIVVDHQGNDRHAGWRTRA